MSILSNLKPNEGSTKKEKRVGRGQGSGWGCTSGRGMNGQKSRSGGSIRRGFEGGQMPLQRRVPKRGFKNHSMKYYAVVNLSDLAVKIPDGGDINLTSLIELGIINGNSERLKILGIGEIKSGYNVIADKVSGTAVKKIEATGGKVTLIEQDKSFAVVTLGMISRTFSKKEGVTEINFEMMKEAGLIPASKTKVEVIGVGHIKNNFKIKANKVSRKARKLIEGIGGKVQLVD